MMYLFTVVLFQQIFTQKTCGSIRQIKQKLFEKKKKKYEYVYCEFWICAIISKSRTGQYVCMYVCIYTVLLFCQMFSCVELWLTNVIDSYWHQDTAPQNVDMSVLRNGKYRESRLANCHKNCKQRLCKSFEKNVYEAFVCFSNST